MISVTLSKIADVLGAEHRGADLTLDTVITDTRKVTPGMPVRGAERGTL